MGLYFSKVFKNVTIILKFQRLFVFSITAKEVAYELTYSGCFIKMKGFKFG